MQRWSKLFIPTLREAPTDAEVASHKLLLRAGYIRQLGAGIYSYLPLGQRSLNKIIAIVRQEMDKIGQEFFLPALNPRELWEESGRWAGMGQNMFHLKDRKGAELCLAMTHEEVMTSIARNELRSYKQLPQIWYQIQTKFRDEPRPRSGLLRVRQFTMKDAYSFDIDAAGLDESYKKHYDTYCRIFKRCGMDFVAVDADSGAMGGSGSQEFMVYTDAGEDLIASSASGYAANLEKATSKLAPVEDLIPTGDTPELVHTPGFRTIDEVGSFLQTKSHHQLKTMAYIVEHPEADAKQIKTVGKTRAVVAFLRGDHQLNETKLAAIALGELRPMTPEEIAETFKAPAGYLGPIGLEAAPHPRKPGVLVVLDAALEGRKNLIAGANKEEYHLRNVTPGRDFKPTVIADIRNINEGELDPIGGEPLRLGKAVEIGHIFKLGYKYSESMGARVLDANGKEVMPIMGCYGIGIERILTAAIESSAAANAQLSAEDLNTKQPAGEQYALPAAIAPFEVIITITNVREADLLAAGEKIAADLEAAGVDVLLDDRDERAGVKFKDAELIGVPYRINIGKKLAEGQVELVDRLTQTTTDLPLDTITAYIQSLLNASKV
ncbi:proline--tRNA ligase [Granulicella sp. S156]|uniref:proline--tRNA ligase n=1 Tax=Granulicella sp. S156 TaxID=1747224 RepID=UPI00131B9515|nr:proline--tRNA ligase [Granulicella sp. S156]